MDAESLQYLRHLTDVPEWIGDVADAHARTKPAASPFPFEQVAQSRFRADQELIRQDVPGTNDQSPAADIATNPLFILRAHGEVVIQDNRLPVEHEMFKIQVVIQEVKHAIDQVDKAKAKFLECPVPFTIPVG